jgi:hypothetical protein
MPTAKLTAASFLDHGIIAAPVAASVFTDTTDNLPVAVAISPIETTAFVMASAKKVSIAASGKNSSALVKLIIAARNPAELAAALIKARYTALGGAKGFLGAAQNAVTPCPDGIGFFQHFAGGSIYWSPSSGAHEAHGLIRQKWAALGWERSLLGYPTTDETPGRDAKHEGRYNHFTGGSIYWHPTNGTFEVHGAIRQKYLELGGEASFLAYPTTDESVCPDRIGRYNHFQGGSIYWTGGTGAREVHGLIRQKWAQLGWERYAALGYPLTDELIPSRTVGSIRVPPIRKPIGNLSLDVLRVPDEQPSPTLVAVPKGTLLANSVSSSSTARFVSVTPTVQPLAMASTSRSLSVAPSTTNLTTTRITLPAARAVLTPIARAKHVGESQDRFGDFQSGVLFWRRGAAEAQELNPSAQTTDGTKLVWTGPEIANLAAVPIRAALAGIGGANVTVVNYTGTTNYTHDGAGVHNRAHRLQVMLQGLHMQGFIPITAFAIVEIRVEINFDPVDREIVGYLTGWNLLSYPGDFIGGGSLPRELAQHLDKALWRQFSVLRIPADVNDLIAVLSVKTQADGRVAVYLEP